MVVVVVVVVVVLVGRGEGLIQANEPTPLEAQRRDQTRVESSFASFQYFFIFPRYVLEEGREVTGGAERVVFWVCCCLFRPSRAVLDIAGKTPPEYEASTYEHGL